MGSHRNELIPSLQNLDTVQPRARGALRIVGPTTEHKDITPLWVGDAQVVTQQVVVELRLEGRHIYALDRIEEGEELTFNYLETESEIASPFVCHDTGRPVDSGACKS